ncbi:MAG: carboxymuconolactone decarboxylase family protein [Thiomicrospira sp.]|uniref:carboxymuconolactone decarboxylase family protein n=1 Tax=Thiomicrospira sp. TaxID=935 RepID=UPI0019F99FF1|nr:carboxymuconolactone decarboxylase family protein [Thiomicrospira sp.]MBE0493748.1 carboxymuconolactone decarboxylase family protein [Thiomicrospira sp.]
MIEFPLHTLDTAPEASKNLLKQTQKNFGFLPNLIAVMASSPAITEAYLTVGDIFAKSSLSPTEQQVVLLTVSHYHECTYCMAAHTAIASMQNVKSDIVQAIRNGHAIADKKLQALRHFTWLLVENRGWVNDEDMQAFIDAGYDQAQMLDVLVGVAQKTLSNFTNHLTKTPLDDVFSEVAWTPSK